MNYPEWQKKIRKAQETVQAINTKEQEKRDAVEAARKRESVEQLKQVLEVFGITGEPDAHGEISVGDFFFYMTERNNDNFNIVKNDDGSLKQATFNLGFRRGHPLASTDDDWERLYGHIVCFGYYDPYKNTKLLAELASELDRIEQTYQFQLEQHQLRSQRQSEPQSSPAPTQHMNVDERFLSAFGDWLHERHKIEHELHDI